MNLRKYDYSRGGALTEESMSLQGVEQGVEIEFSVFIILCLFFWGGGGGGRDILSSISIELHGSGLLHHVK